MENFNKSSLNAAVKKYDDLHKAGKQEAEVKEAISKDEKNFTEDQINSIYQAILNPEPEPEKKKSYVIASPFKDKTTKQMRLAGEPAKYEGDRLKELIDKKLVKESK